MIRLETPGDREEPVRAQLKWATEWYGLTPRQCDIVWAVYSGLTEDAQIARHLGIAPSTVKIHFAILYEHLGVSNRLGVMLRLFGKPVRNDYTDEQS